MSHCRSGRECGAACVAQTCCIVKSTYTYTYSLPGNLFADGSAVLKRVWNRRQDYYYWMRAMPCYAVAPMNHEAGP